MGLMNRALALGLLLGICNQAFAQRDFDQTYFAPRNQANCQNSDPEFTAWFMNETNQVPRIHQILGPVRNQGYTAQCYALAAADLITASTKVRVSGAQVAHLYYKKSFTGTIQKLFGNNQGGFIASAIGAVEGQNVCVEETPATLVEDPNPQHSGVFCNNNSVQMKSFAVRGMPASGLHAGHQLFPLMDQLLNKKTIVGISYRAQDIFAGFQISGFNSFANHASTVVARQWNKHTRTCDYVIRNSWGEGCTQSLGLCNRGYYSIAEELIDKAAQKVDYIK